MDGTGTGVCKWGGTMGTNGSQAAARGAAFNLIVLRSNRDRDQWYSTVIFRPYGGRLAAKTVFAKCEELSCRSRKICVFKTGNFFLPPLLLLLLLLLPLLFRLGVFS